MSPDSLKPQFFVTRQNGSMVPLIAMDELPSTIGIRNVSRSLSPYDISGMTGIGTYESRHLNYVVDTPDTYNKSALVDRSLMASRYATPVDHHLTPPSMTGTLHQAPPKAYGIQEQAPASPLKPMAPSCPASRTSTPVHRIDRNASPVQQPLPHWKDTSTLPTNIRSAPGVKEYCSYWLRNGECDYAQQGCLYKHEMPLDRATLERLGHRDIPKWYREKHGLGSYHAVSSTLGEETVGRKYTKPEMNHSSWRRGGRDRRGSNSEMEGLRSSVGRMDIGVHGSGDVNRNTRDVPIVPPSTPLLPTQNMAPVPASTYFANANQGRNTANTNRRQIHIQGRPMETMQQQQTRATLAAHEQYEREQRTRLMPSNIITTNNHPSKLIEVEDRPTTAGSSSNSTVASVISARSATPNPTPVEIGTPETGDVNTPATSTENSASDSENTTGNAGAESPKSILDSPIHEPKTPVLRPSVGGEKVRTPRSAPRSTPTSASTSARRGPVADRRLQGRRGAVDARKGVESERKSGGRRHAAAESEGEFESVGRGSQVRGSVSRGGRKGSVAGSVGGSATGSAKARRRGGKGNEKVRNQKAKDRQSSHDGYDHSD